MQGLYLLGNQRERALLKADGQNQYLGLNSLPGAGLRARGQALLRASRTCSEDGFVTSPVVREKWAGKQRGERKGCPARCRGLLGEIKNGLAMPERRKSYWTPRPDDSCV